MHPLLAYGIGVLIGALVCGLFYGYSEIYQRVALTIGMIVVVLGGVALMFWLKIPSVSGFKQVAAVIAVGFSAKLGGYNIGVGSQTGEGGFSSGRTESMIGVTIAMVILALSIPALKPG